MPFSLLQAKENGEVTEQAAASMSEEAYNLLCKHAVTAGSAFRWAWLTLQWNLGCRSVNVAKVLLSHMGVEGDAITISFARTKSDLAGDIRHLKHVYCNPHCPQKCSVLALAVLLMSTATNRGSNGAEPASRLFQGKTQAHRFNEQLSKAVAALGDELRLLGFLEEGEIISTHSVRKGMGTMLASKPGGPGIITICLRLSWALGQVMSAYLKLEAGGDCFVGRVAACLDLSSADFAVLPPHFDDPNGQDVVAAGAECFGDVWSSNPDLRGLLVRLLASVVYHQEYLTTHFGGGNSAMVQGLALFQDKDRLGRLKLAVTTEPGHLTATGVPPTVFLFKKLEILGSELKTLATAVEEMPDKIVQQFIGLRDSEIEHAGFVTRDVMETALQAQSLMISEQIKLFVSGFGASQHAHPDQPALPGPGDTGTLKWGKYPNGLLQRHGGISPYYDTPGQFSMPDSSETLGTVARLWYLGNPGHPSAGNGCKIKPYRWMTNLSFGPTPAFLQKRGVTYKQTYPADHQRWVDNKSTLTALNAVMKPFDDVISAANSEAGEGQEPIDLDDENMTEQTFKTVFDLGVAHLQKNVIPHVYTNGNSQQRFGQCHWTSFRQWMKPAVIMKTGNQAACKYLALQITTAGGFEREAAYLKRKHSITPEQLGELESGVPCKRARVQE